MIGKAPMAPGMDQGALGWMIRTARKNHWRVSAYIDLDDLIQDGYFFWVRVSRKYPAVTDQPHRMRLFQTAFNNHLTNLASRRTRQPNFLPLMVQQLEDETGRPPEHELIELPPTTIAYSDHGNFRGLVRRAIEVLGSDAGAAAWRAPYPRRPDGTRETTNERLCRIVGVDPTRINMLAVLRAAL